VNLVSRQESTLEILFGLCSKGKYVESMSAEVYDAQTEVSNRISVSIAVLRGMNTLNGHYLGDAVVI
jgi:hypothetical protein